MKRIFINSLLITELRLRFLFLQIQMQRYKLKNSFLTLYSFLRTLCIALSFYQIMHLFKKILLCCRYKSFFIFILIFCLTFTLWYHNVLWQEVIIIIYYLFNFYFLILFILLRFENIWERYFIEKYYKEKIITYAILATLILQFRTLIIQYNQLRRLFENFAV